MDSRFELYPAAIMADYLAIERGGDAAADVLDRWHVNLVALEVGTAPPTGWIVVTSDADGTILIREAQEATVTQ